MSHPDNPEADPVALRLKPEYWDGEVFGQGEITEPNYTEQVPGKVKRLGPLVLTEYLDRPEGRMSLGVVAEGDIFDPNEYAPGTIVAMNQEKLIHFPDLDIPGEMPEGSVPEPDKTIPYDKGSVGKTTQAIGLGSTGYQQWTEWGIVVSSSKWKRSHGLFTPASVEMFNESIPVIRQAALYTGGITVGKVVRRQTTEEESLRRTNALEICGRGKTASSDHDDSRPWRFRPEFGGSS